MTKQEKALEDIQGAREDEKDAETAYKQALKQLEDAERWVRSRKIAWAEAVVHRVEIEREAALPEIKF